MALSNMPCADMEVNSAAHKTAQFSSEANHTHDKDNDLCSPFCACNCCGAQVLSYQAHLNFEFPVTFSIISIQLPNLQFSFCFQFLRKYLAAPSNSIMIPSD